MAGQKPTCCLLSPPPLPEGFCWSTAGPDAIAFTLQPPPRSCPPTSGAQMVALLGVLGRGRFFPYVCVIRCKLKGRKKKPIWYAMVLMSSPIPCFLFGMEFIVCFFLERKLLFCTFDILPFILKVNLEVNS